MHDDQRSVKDEAQRQTPVADLGKAHRVRPVSSVANGTNEL
jgi:hypothetical protein